MSDWVLVCFVLCGKIKAVSLPYPGFLFVSSYAVRLKQSHSRVLGSVCSILCGQTQADVRATSLQCVLKEFSRYKLPASVKLWKSARQDTKNNG